jgi:hypothetical protein
MKAAARAARTFSPVARGRPMTPEPDPRRTPHKKAPAAKTPPMRKVGGVHTTTITHAPPGGTQPHPHAVPPAPTVEAPKDAPVALARRTLLEALFKALGQPGSLLDHPHGQSFTVRLDVGEGAVHTHRTLMVSLPKGGSVPHTADISVELEDGRAVYVDILDSNARLQDLKAHAFDAGLLKKQHKKPFAVLVLVRLPHPLHSQDLVEALAHEYDYVFGIDENNVVLETKFAACQSELLKRLGVGG